MKQIIIEETPSKVTVTYDPTPLELPIYIQEQHQLFWDKQIKQNPHLRNGEVFTISEINKSSEELKLTVVKTDYKHYLYTIRNENSPFPCKVIFTCVAVITKDNYIAFGQMSPNTSTPGRLQFTGGGLDESDLDGCTFDLVKSIGKELEEEMGLQVVSSYSKSFYPKFVKYQGVYDFWAVMFELQVDYSAEELQVIFHEHNQYLINQGEQPEFDKFLFISLDKKSVYSFIQNDSSPKEDYLEPILMMYAEKYNF